MKSQKIKTKYLHAVIRQKSSEFQKILEDRRTTQQRLVDEKLPFQRLIDVNVMFAEFFHRDAEIAVFGVS